MTPRSRHRVLRVMAVAFTLACQPAERQTQVVLISLDGAGAVDLWSRWQAGDLNAGGFSRFFADGQVARSLQPVEPTLTAPNHVSLASGYPSAVTGIVGNELVPPGSDLLPGVSGFSAPIATETLWEAARRQGKRVGVVVWPGADGSGHRRRGDWGQTWVVAPEVPPRLWTCAGSDWRPWEGGAPVESVSSAMECATAPPGWEGLRLVAVDGRGDDEGGYDGVLLMEARRSRPLGHLAEGKWLRLAPAGGGAAWVKLLDWEPDLAAARLYLGGAFHNQAYPAAFAADLRDQGLLWPGPPDDEYLAASRQGAAGIDLDTWLEQLERFGEFFFAVLERGLASRPWDLVLAYVPTLDEVLHLPAASTSEAAVDAARRRAWEVVDRGLASLLSRVDLRSTTVVVVSDHGGLPIHTEVFPNRLLERAGFLASQENGRQVDLGRTRAWVWSSAGFGQAYVNLEGRQPAGIVAAAEAEALVAELQRLFAGLELEGEPAFEAVLTRTQAHALGLAHPAAGDVLLFARPGYTLGSELAGPGPLQGAAVGWGQHGYLARHADMAGIYLALGAGVAPGRPARIQATEVAPRVAELLGIEPPRRRP